MKITLKLRKDGWPDERYKIERFIMDRHWENVIKYIYIAGAIGGFVGLFIGFILAGQ